MGDAEHLEKIIDIIGEETNMYEVLDNLLSCRDVPYLRI